jgi:HSP20 family protein
MNWDPLQEFVGLRDRALQRARQPDTAWTPSVDLLETESAFLFVIELPGLGAADFTINATSDGLSVTGQRPAVTPAPQRFFRMERGHGRFSRTFTFSEAVDANGIKATFERGLLNITVPKAASRADRRITVR